MLRTPRQFFFGSSNNKAEQDRAFAWLQHGFNVEAGIGTMRGRYLEDDLDIVSTQFEPCRNPVETAHWDPRATNLSFQPGFNSVLAS